jgi:methyltransferase
MAQDSLAQRMEKVIREYIHACNRADANAIAACFSPEAVHYFPTGYSQKWSGASTIGDNFARVVRARGRCWTVDQVLVDVERHAGVLEWTSFTGQNDSIMRGVDWFVFDPQTLRIQEVRPYTAAPVQPTMARQELGDFDYAVRGYPTSRPPQPE